MLATIASGNTWHQYQKKKAKTGKNFGLYMQNQLLLGIVWLIQADQLPITLPSLIHVTDLFMEGGTDLWLHVPSKATPSLSYIMLA